MRPSRADTLAATLPRRRVNAAEAEHASLTGFCARHQVPVDLTAVLLYVTHLQTSTPNATGRWLRNRLAALDLAERLHGRQPWTQHPDLGRYLNGMHDSHPLGRPEWSDPLYAEHVNAMMQATHTLSAGQVRDQAALMLRHDTGLSRRALADLRWDLVHLTRACATLTLPAYPSGAPRPRPPIRLNCTLPHRDCVVHALHELRRLTGRRNGPVLASSSGAVDLDRLYVVTAALRDHRCDITPIHTCPVRDAHLVTARSDTAVACRDRALLAVSFSAALGAQEATNLLCDDIDERRQGLLVSPAGRREPVLIRTADDPLGTDTAWTAWLDCRAAQTLQSPLAFLQVNGSRIMGEPLALWSLNDAVQRCARQAGLRGTYTYTSLRVGLIRTLLRDGAPAHVVAGRADMRSLSGVERHAARENVLRDNVAARLGL